MSFYTVFPVVVAGCAMLMDFQRARVDNGWLGFCLLISFVTQFMGNNRINPVSWILGFLTPLLILGWLFIFRMLGPGDIKLFCVIGTILGPDKILACIAISILIGAVISASILISNGIICQRFLYLFRYITKFLETRRTKTLLQKWYATGKFSFYSSHIFKQHCCMQEVCIEEKYFCGL